MINWSGDSWRSVLDGSPEGIVICESKPPEYPVVYANAAFSQMCGYPVSALIGTNLRTLQGNDREQDARVRMRDAIVRGQPCRTLIRNYRPDGSLFWNEVVIQPIRDESSRVTHFIGYHRDASERLKSAEKSEQGLPQWMREDRLTGLHSRPYFEELLRRDWLLAQRDSHEIGLVLFDIDFLGTYNETFDRAGGDGVIRRVSRVIEASYRRGGDLVGRWDGGTFAVLTQGEAAERACQYAGVVSQRVRDLLIHHPRAGASRYVTMSAGVASLVPPRELTLDSLLKACRTALDRAKKQGKNGIASAEAGDFS